MAKFVFGMNLSLDGYVDHLEMHTGPELFRHWIEQVRSVTGSMYGRTHVRDHALLGRRPSRME